MLNDPSNTGFETVELTAFAILRSGAGQFHTGLLYKIGKKVHLRHQCDHLVVKDGEPSTDSDYLWTNISALSALNKRLIANKLSRAGGDNVPYGVGYRVNGNYLDKRTLKYIATNPGDGLTCATYVVAVMETLGFRPFETEKWLPIDEDTAWQRDTIESQMGRHPESKEHFEAEKANIGSPRFRPDQVVAAGYPPTWPLTQAQANELGEKVISSYDAQRPFTR
jgi:hypothetical protein